MKSKIGLVFLLVVLIVVGVGGTAFACGFDCRIITQCENCGPGFGETRQYKLCSVEGPDGDIYFCTELVASGGCGSCVTD